MRPPTRPSMLSSSSGLGLRSISSFEVKKQDPGSPVPPPVSVEPPYPEKFPGALYIHYLMVSENLSKTYNGYSSSFFVPHSLSCIKGSFGIVCHNEMCNELIQVCQTCYSKSTVYNEPTLHTVVLTASTKADPLTLLVEHNPFYSPKPYP